MASKSKPFESLRCPHCGEVDSLIVRVDTLTLGCESCSEEVTQKEVDALFDQWRRLFAWIDKAAE